MYLRRRDLPQWRLPPRDCTVSILPDVTGPINWAVTTYGAPKPAGEYLFLQVEQWAPYAAVGSIFTFDGSQAVDAGLNVNTWRPNPFGTLTDATTGHVMNQIFSGIQVDITIRENASMIYRLPYNITLLARITSEAI